MKKVGLSTSSVYPESTAVAFELASSLGFDGVEVMVGIDDMSQDLATLQALQQYYGVPVLSIHAPCLLVTQCVWGTDPWGKLKRAKTVAEALGAQTVVVHPPFRWQRSYARDFDEGLARLAEESEVRFAVENMFPWRVGIELDGYAPDWDPRNLEYPHVTLDLSHTAAARIDAVRMVADLGSRLQHVHLADGSGSARDEHLIPGRGSEPLAEVLARVSGLDISGSVIAEVSTRAAGSRQKRVEDLRQTLDFARAHLDSSNPGSK